MLNSSGSRVETVTSSTTTDSAMLSARSASSAMVGSGTTSRPTMKTTPTASHSSMAEARRLVPAGWGRAAAVMRRAGEMIGKDAELGLVAWKEQNLLHADRPVRDFGFVKPWHLQLAEAQRWQAEAPERRWLFVLGAAFGACIDADKAQYVGHANRREWFLLRADAFRSGCDPALQKAAVQDDPGVE